MGFGVRRKEKVNVAVQRFCVVNEVQSKCDITPLSGSTSTVTSFVPIDKDLEFGAINQLDALVNAGPSHVSGTTP